MSHVELYFFACGHGDTLLLRLPDDRWVLVDCYLPTSGGVRQRFFKFLEDKKVHRLAAVFQTHPDYDHFLGMHAVLKHFIDRGETIGIYADSGLNAQQIKILLEQRGNLGQREYAKLQDALAQWDAAGKIRWCELDAERPAFIPKGFAGRIALVPVAPDPRMRRRLTQQSIQKLGANPQARLEANELSLVLALTVRDGATKFNALLTADADAPSLARAMKLWREHAKENNIAPCFDVVKVSHHGSIHNHSVELCQHGPHAATVTKVAAISAGEREALPDRHVIEAYHQAGWTVVATTIRMTPTRNRPGDAHFRKSAPSTTQQQTIELQWRMDGSFQFQPPTAVIERNHVSAYATAKK